MTYEKTHTNDHCDRCLKKVGKENLKQYPFLYKDMNDDMHKDEGKGYRQYYICNECFEKEFKIKKKICKLRKEPCCVCGFIDKTGNFIIGYDKTDVDGCLIEIYGKGTVICEDCLFK